MQDTGTELARAVLAADAQLGSTTDPSVHLWALVCLLRAAEASGLFLSKRCLDRRNGYGGSDAVEALGVAWRTAWSTLLRADQRFCSLTGRCERSGVGEAVVAVLGACMREGLVEAGLVTKEQVGYFVCMCARAWLDADDGGTLRYFYEYNKTMIICRLALFFSISGCKFTVIEANICVLRSWGTLGPVPRVIMLKCVLESFFCFLNDSCCTLPPPFHASSTGSVVGAAVVSVPC